MLQQLMSEDGWGDDGGDGWADDGDDLDMTDDAAANPREALKPADVEISQESAPGGDEALPEWSEDSIVKPPPIPGPPPIRPPAPPAGIVLSVNRTLSIILRAHITSHPLLSQSPNLPKNANLVGA